MHSASPDILGAQGELKGEVPLYIQIKIILIYIN
jgi:hypothetical protein